MSRSMRIQRLVFVPLAICGFATTWWGCSAAPDQTTGGSSNTTSAGGGGAGGMGGTGGMTVDTGGGTTTTSDTTPCVSTSAEAQRVPLDIIFLVDRSSSMQGDKWDGTTSALATFCNDPASTKIGVGLAYFPSFSSDICDPVSYQALNVPIASLPFNAFPITNSFPAEATAYGTPTWPALKGVLTVATAHQDANPTHKVVVVLATDGDPFACEPLAISEVAKLAQSALDYNGVRTFVIGVEGSIIPNLDEIAAAGGTTAAYDITDDINEFTAKMKEIRTESLGCEFEIPPLPNGKELEPDEVNFTYTPAGVGEPKVLLRANDLGDCMGKPGWYFDSNAAPTKILLCPVSCVTVQADVNAKVDVLFGCQSQVN